MPLTPEVAPGAVSCDLSQHAKHLWLFLLLVFTLVNASATLPCTSPLLPLLSDQFLKLQGDFLKVYEGFCPIEVNLTMLFLVPIFLIKITQANMA